ncbi:MAG: hypothetical protein J0L64_23905 [Acidobacteria bacterium]|nr:hypothetical protein [Acidobacteriota bacterium]
MRLIALFLASTLIVSAAELSLTTGQAARLVIGQPTFTAATPGASESLLGAISGLAYANNTLFVVDSNRLGATPVNHRVLLFKNLSNQLPAPEAELEVNFNRCQICVGAADVVLGQPDFKTAELKAASATTMRTPGAVATDGRVLAVSDSDNNRVLIWRSIPATNQQPADVVLGQPDFTRVVPNDVGGFTPNNRSLRGPAGVWIQDGRLYVADTGNNRVLIWNSIPSSNHQPADLVLGAPDFNTSIQPDLTKATIDAKANTLLTPVSVTSDGRRLFVSDLGHNRVLIWNTLPSRNQQPADVVIGQRTMETAVANNVTELCEPADTDDEGKPLYLPMCAATVDFPRYALSDGTRLFVADGGNDRILVYNTIPTENGKAADAVLGQVRDTLNTVSDSADPDGIASSGVIRTPLSLAFDGRNLYASDPFNRRVMVFTFAERRVPNTGVRNSASREVFAVASVSFAGEVKENDEVEVKIQDRSYKYKAAKDDTFGKLIDGLVAAINGANGGAGDVDVLATPNKALFAIIFTARAAGAPGNDVEFTVTQTSGTTILPTTSGAFLTGGQDAAKIAPGTVVAILGEDLAEETAAAPENAEQLPRDLAGVQVYFDGIRAPLYWVSPTEIRAQMPWEVRGSQSANAIVRTVRRDGRTISVTSAISVPLVAQNPGIYAEEGVADPRPGIVLHGSSFATGTVSVDGSIRANDVATVTIEDRKYEYTVVEGDTLASVRDKLIERINQDPKVEAFPAAAFTRIRLRARVAGPEFNGLAIGGSSRDGDQVIITATNSQLCCANTAGARVTEDNPAVPGETIIVLATGLGGVKPEDAGYQQVTGRIYEGDALNDPLEFVSSLAGSKTANVLSAGLMPGTVGLYQVVLELNSDLPTNPQTQMTIAQDIYVSNIVTFPIFNPNPSATN